MVPIRTPKPTVSIAGHPASDDICILARTIAALRLSGLYNNEEIAIIEKQMRGDDFLDFRAVFSKYCEAV